MHDRILVAYATRHGATAEIAERIGEVLRDTGLLVDVRPANGTRSLTPYRAVVLGSGMYAGRWLKKAVHFLGENEAALAEHPVWLFSSGPTGEGDAEELAQGWGFPRALRAIAARIKPRDIAVFHGKIDPSHLGLLEKLMIRGAKAPVGDYRDWVAIVSWAESIADELAN